MYLRTSVDAELEIAGKHVWDLLIDFSADHQIDSFIKLCPISNGIESGLGAEHEVQLYDGSSIRQTILDYDEGRSLLVGFTQTDLPIKQGTARFVVDPPDQAFCRVSIEITYEPKFGLIGGMFGLCYEPMLRSRYYMVLRGLEKYVTNGYAIEAT